MTTNDVSELAPRTLKLCFPLGDDIDVMLHILGGTPTSEQFEQIRQHITLVESSLQVVTDTTRVNLAERMPRRSGSFRTTATEEKRDYLINHYPQRTLEALAKETELGIATVRSVLIKAGVLVVNHHHRSVRPLNGVSH